MNTQRSRAIAALTLLIVFLDTMVFASPKKVNELYHVKKIYIWNESETAGTPARIEWLSDLKRELTNVGFLPVDNANEADVILHDEIQEEVVVDGPQPDPPKYFFDFKLTFRNDDVVWHTKFKVRSRLKPTEVNEQAAKQLSQRLLGD